MASSLNRAGTLKSQMPGNVIDRERQHDGRMSVGVRRCSRCKKHRTMHGGTTKNGGKTFICRDCK